MTRAAAKSLAKNNIRVCAVSPHLIEGSMADSGINYMAEVAMQGKKTLNQVVVNLIC